MSIAIQSLKTVNESLKQNYTSFQLLSTLDDLQFKAVCSVIKCSNFVDRVLAQTLAYNVINPRRKVSSIPKAKYHGLVFAYLATTDVKTKIKIFKRLRLERSLVFFIVNTFCTKILPFTPNKEVSHNTILFFSLTQIDTAWYNAREAHYWITKAHEFKNMIIEKYMRLIVNEATNFYKMNKSSGTVFDLDEITQNFFIATARAIDKCDAQRGTLTTYVLNWIKDAKTNSECRGEYGIAYNIPQSFRRQIASKSVNSVNIATSIDASLDDLFVTNGSPEHERMHSESMYRIQRIAKKVDPIGLGRFSLNIDEVLSPREIKLLRRENEKLVKSRRSLVRQHKAK